MTITTIVCNKDYIAGDLLFTYGGSIKFKGKTKVFSFDNDFPKEFNAGKVVLGFCGDSRTIPTCLEYILNGGKKPRVSGIEMLVLTDKKEIWTGTSFTNWVQHDVNYFSIGSGSMFALGAMAAGASPEEAIEKASELDVYTGLGITKEYL